MNLKNKHVLIVDDDPFLTALLSQKLEDGGFGKVTVVRTWLECLQHFQDCDAVILDYFLKEENGMDILCGLKTLKPNLPIIFLSGQEFVSVAIKTLRLGAFDYVEKHQLNFDKMVEIITEALKKNENTSNGSLNVFGK